MIEQHKHATPREIRHPERWLKRKSARMQRRQRGRMPAHYRLIDIPKQIELLQRRVDAINWLAMGEHLKKTGTLDGFAAPLDIHAVARMCVKRVEKHYGLRNRYHHWKK
jgi:hypothetical protein